MPNSATMAADMVLSMEKTKSSCSSGESVVLVCDMMKPVCDWGQDLEEDVITSNE